MKLYLATAFKTHRVPEFVFKLLAAIGLAKRVEESIPEAGFYMRGYWFRGIFFLYGKESK